MFYFNLIKNYKNVAYLSAIGCCFLSCGKNNKSELTKENKNLSNYYVDNKTVDHINIDPFGPKFLNDLEVAVSDKDFDNIDKIKEIITKLRDPSYVFDNESKYKSLIELAKVLPPPFMIDEKNLYNNKYNYIAEQIKVYYEKTAKPVPKELHFIWLGGPLGEIQKEYVKIWAKINPQYVINIWYDSDHLYTYETNKRLKEFLNYTLAGAKNDPNYKRIFTEKYINLQNDMFIRIMKKSKENSSDFSFDKERLNYIEKILYNNTNVSYEKIEKNLNTMLNDSINITSEYSNIKIKDFKVNKYYWQLKNTYEQEMLLRGNFAAAGDSARLEILARFGGLYMDIDLLPSIKQLNSFIETHKDGVYKKYIPQRFREFSLLFFEHILNQHKDLLPSRKVSNKYRTQFISNINRDNTLEPQVKSLLKTAVQSTLTKIKDIKDISEIFNKLEDVNIRVGEFKAAEDSNNFIAAHQVKSNTDWVHILRDKITENYKKLNKIEKNNPNFFYAYDKNYILTTDKANYIDPKRESKSFFNYYIHDYRKDSIADTRITIYTSGPGVLSSLHEDLFPEFLSERGNFYKNLIVKNATEFSLKNSIFNNATEEDVNSSWASKTSYHDGERFGSRNIILAVGQEENIKNASEYILSKKQTEKIPVSLINSDNLEITNKENSDYEKVNLFIVGHAEIEDNSIKIGNYTAAELATKISEFTETNKNHVIDYIDIISCNPTNNPNDTVNIETFSKLLIENLHNLGVSLDIITIRKNIIKIDNNGNELVRSKYGIYNFSNDADKIYIVRKGRNDFISITTDNIIEQIQADNIKNLNKFNTTIKNIISKKSAALGDFSDTIDKIKTAYSNLKSSRNNSIDSGKVNYSYSSSKTQRAPSLSSVTKQVAKYSFKGLDKFTSVTNKYNVFMNFLNTPKTLNNITSSFSNHMYLEGGREAADFTINNADLVLDIVKSYKGVSYWQQHAQAFQNINRAQIGLNLVSAGLDVWRAYDLYRNAYVTEEQSRKIDSIVNASFVTARAASSIGTAVFLPLTAKAGPVGAAIGYTIMFSQGTYNAVRTSQELRKLGFKEEEITLKSILKFFGHYEEMDDPSYVTKIEANKLNNSIIPNILNEKNKEYFTAMEKGKGEESKLFYFNKIVYPKIDLYIPYTTETIITGCYYGICVPSKSGGKRVENESHSCLTNNSYYSSQAHKNAELNALHLNAIQEYSGLLENKKAEKPQAPKGEYYSQATIQHNNNTVPCPSVTVNTPMIEKAHVVSDIDIQKVNSIPAHKKANLYLLGFGDQGKHGNMIHSVSGEVNEINLYNIHSSTYMLHIYGGNKEDIFEFYDTVQSKNKNKGVLDGGEGIDTINILGIKDKKITISLDANKPSDFPEMRNIENVFATDEDDIIYGNNKENFLVGNGGNDEIYGNDGDDTLVPSFGFDKLNGGKGKDTYYILLKDLKNSDMTKITNNFDIIFSEIKDIKGEMELFNKKINEITNNTELVYSKINTYNSYMFEIKDICNKTNSLIINLKESGIKILKKAHVIKQVSESMAKSVKYYDGKELSISSEVEALKRISSYISHFESAVKTNLIYAEQFLKQANDFQIANEGYDARIHQFSNSSFGMDNQSQFNRSMAMQTRSIKEAYISSQVINFSNTKMSTILNLNSVSNNAGAFLLKLQDINYQLQSASGKLSPIYYGVKTINNYDALFDNANNNDIDLIKTDIKNLISKKSQNNLILGFYQGKEFVQAIIIKDYFVSDNYRHILLTDLLGNIYSTLNGSLYVENEEESELNTVKLFNKMSEFYLDKMDLPLLDKKKNIVATLGNDTIHGNSYDNFIFGNGGFDKIFGYNGNDTISIEMNSNFKKDESDDGFIELFKSFLGYQSLTEINGGKGSDNYVLNFSKNTSILNEYKVNINNEDTDKELDNLIINDLYSDIESIYFAKEKNEFDTNYSLKILFQDKNKKEYAVVIKNWFVSEDYRHLQLQVGSNLSITENILNEISNSIENNSLNYVLKLYTDKSFKYSVHSFLNSFNYINMPNYLEKMEEINFNLKETDFNNLVLRISKIENEIVFKIINTKEVFHSSFVVIRDELENISELKKLKIKINNNIFIENTELINYINSINSGEVIDIAIE